jgi:hypothetical protein
MTYIHNIQIKRINRNKMYRNFRKYVKNMKKWYLENQFKNNGINKDLYNKLMIIIRLFIKQIIKDKISSIFKIIDLKGFWYGNLLIK